jgi:hypothetical protein
MQHDLHVQFDDRATTGGSQGTMSITFDQADPQRAEICTAAATVLERYGRFRDASELLGTGRNRPVGGHQHEPTPA